MGLEERHAPFLKLTFKEAIVDSLAANIAVIDGSGEILAVNARWQHFAVANQMSDETCGVGANYFDVCRAAGADPNARAALKGIPYVPSSSPRKARHPSRSQVRGHHLSLIHI